MMKYLSKRAKIFFVLPICLSAACSAGQTTTELAQQDDVQRVEVSSSGKYIKPGAAIDYSYDLPKSISAGQTVTFTLSLNESYDTGAMKVDLAAEGALQIFATNTQANFDMQLERRHDLPISFTAMGNGRHYINVQATADAGDGQVMPRAFSIPVQVGSLVAMEPHEDMQTAPSGENIIVMDAEEDIK